MLCDHIIQTHYYLDFLKTLFGIEAFYKFQKENKCCRWALARVRASRGGTVQERHVSVSSPTSLIVGSVASTDTRYSIFICLQLYNFKFFNL